MNIIDIDDGTKGDIVSTLTRELIYPIISVFFHWFLVLVFGPEFSLHSLFSGQRLFFVALIWQPNYF